MAKSIKKLLSLALVLIMVLSMIPAVFATETTPAYTTNAGGWVEIGTASQFNKWFYNKGSDDTYILQHATEPVTAKLVLTGDIVMNIAGTMGSSSDTFGHNIVLDLNGHTITASHTSRIMSAYHGNLTIMNSKEEGGIIATGANNASVVGNMIYAGKNSTVNLVNVNITRSENTHASKAGGILGATDGGTVNIIDCVLDGNNTGYGEAGGVIAVQSSGTINFFSGTIKNGTALKGGNVYVSTGTFNMYGGEICGGYLPATTFGTEEANGAANGGGVYVTGTGVFNMYGGEIHNNTSTYGYSRGGNVYVHTESKTHAPVFNMYGGKIYNGDAVLGDNVYAYALTTGSSATVNFYGGEVGASKTGTDARNNIYINKAYAVCNIYGGTFKYLPATGGSATLNTAECATYTEATEETDHIYTHGTAGETVAATCVTPGYTAYSCETCQKEWKVYTTLAAHTPAVKEGVAGTCTTDGVTEGAYCTVCNHDLIPQLTVAGGHTYEASYISPEAMDTAGTYVYTCSVCGDTYQEADTLKRDLDVGELDVSDDTSSSVADSRGSHIFVRVTGLDPEKTQGFIAVKVYAGEKLLATTVRPESKPLMLEFAPINIEISRDTKNWDTTWEEGALCAELVPTHFEVYYGDLETVRGIYAFALTAEEWAAHPGVATGGAHYPMEPVKENEVPQTCETAGSYDLVVYCEQCDLEISRETVEVPAHTPEVIPAVDATCTTTGLTEGSKCSVCGEILVAQEEVAISDHAWDEGIYTEPTYEADGYTTYTCTACGETKVETDEGSMLTKAEITKQPEPIEVESGTEVQFHVEVEGNVVSYKWEYRKVFKWFNTSMTGYNTDTLTVTATGARNGYDYRCLITFADGTQIYSEPAELSVITHITDVVGPNDQIVVNGYKGQFTASAQGETIKYKWYYQRPDDTQWYETAMEGNNKPTVMIETNAQRDGYKYRCKITDVTGVEVWTEYATMRVLSFKQHPVETFAPTTGTVQFTVSTSVDSGFTYQWQYRRSATGNWTNTTLEGYNTATLTVPAKGKNGYEYRCVLTGSKNSKLESKGAVLHVGDPVEIIAQPQSVTCAAGENAVFSVEATNVYAYQWKYSKNGTTWYTTSAEGNQTASLTIEATTGRNGYQYRCHIYGIDGTETITEVVTLNVG